MLNRRGRTVCHGAVGRRERIVPDPVRTTLVRSGRDRRGADVEYARKGDVCLYRILPRRRLVFIVGFQRRRQPAVDPKPRVETPRDDLYALVVGPLGRAILILLSQGPVAPFRRERTQERARSSRLACVRPHERRTRGHTGVPARTGASSVVHLHRVVLTTVIIGDIVFIDLPLGPPPRAFPHDEPLRHQTKEPPRRAQMRTLPWLLTSPSLPKRPLMPSSIPQKQDTSDERNSDANNDRQCYLNWTPALRLYQDLGVSTRTP